LVLAAERLVLGTSVRWALVLVPFNLALSGCAADAEHGAASSPVVLDGTYAAKEPGEIQSIRFSESDQYVMWQAPCPRAGEAACFVSGTFALNDARTEIVLTDDETRQSRRLPFQVLSSSSGVHIAGIPVVAETGIVNGESRPVTQSARIGSQQVELVAAHGARLLSQEPCAFSVPISGDPSSFYTSVKAAVEGRGGVLRGDASRGSFSVSGVAGTYMAQPDGSVVVTITPESLGMIRTCSRVYGALSQEV
jgi:hypothetical protein